MTGETITEINEDEIVRWFRQQKTHTRISCATQLLHSCQPPELRFLGAVLEQVAKKDSVQLRAFEHTANKPMFWETRRDLYDTFDRAQCTMALSLLKSTNHHTALPMFKMLMNFDWSHVGTSSSFDDQLFDDVLLILTMARLHPAFSCDQKMRLTTLLRDIRRVILLTHQQQQQQQCSSADLHNHDDEPDPNRQLAGAYPDSDLNQTILNVDVGTSNSSNRPISSASMPPTQQQEDNTTAQLRLDAHAFHSEQNLTHINTDENNVAIVRTPSVPCASTSTAVSDRGSLSPHPQSQGCATTASSSDLRMSETSVQPSSSSCNGSEAQSSSKNQTPLSVRITNATINHAIDHSCVTPLHVPIMITWSDGSQSTAQRTFDEFNDFNRLLLDIFPQASGAHGNARVLPRIITDADQPREDNLGHIFYYLKDLEKLSAVDANAFYAKAAVFEFLGRPDLALIVRTRQSDRLKTSESGTIDTLTDADLTDASTATDTHSIGVGKSRSRQTKLPVDHTSIATNVVDRNGHIDESATSTTATSVADETSRSDGATKPPIDEHLTMSRDTTSQQPTATIQPIESNPNPVPDNQETTSEAEQPHLVQDIAKAAENARIPEVQLDRKRSFTVDQLLLMSVETLQERCQLSRANAQTFHTTLHAMWASNKTNGNGVAGTLKNGMTMTQIKTSQTQKSDAAPQQQQQQWRNSNGVPHGHRQMYDQPAHPRTTMRANSDSARYTSTRGRAMRRAGGGGFRGLSRGNFHASTDAPLSVDVDVQPSGSGTSSNDSTDWLSSTRQFPPLPATAPAPVPHPVAVVSSSNANPPPPPSLRRMPSRRRGSTDSLNIQQHSAHSHDGLGSNSTPATTTSMAEMQQQIAAQRKSLTPTATGGHPHGDAAANMNVSELLGHVVDSIPSETTITSHTSSTATSTLPPPPPHHHTTMYHQMPSHAPRHSLPVPHSTMAAASQLRYIHPCSMCQNASPTGCQYCAPTRAMVAAATTPTAVPAYPPPPHAAAPLPFAAHPYFPAAQPPPMAPRGMPVYTDNSGNAQTTTPGTPVDYNAAWPWQFWQPYHQQQQRMMIMASNDTIQQQQQQQSRAQQQQQQVIRAPNVHTGGNNPYNSKTSCSNCGVSWHTAEQCPQASLHEVVSPGMFQLRFNNDDGVARDDAGADSLQLQQQQQQQQQTEENILIANK